MHLMMESRVPLRGPKTVTTYCGLTVQQVSRALRSVTTNPMMVSCALCRKAYDVAKIKDASGE